MKTNVGIQLFVFCLLLLVIRIVKTDHFSFLFLLWNLFLAWLPYRIMLSYTTQKHKAVQVLLLALTVLFLPNAPYIVTDLFHLTKHLAAPLWYDLVLILSFSLLGLVLFILTLEKLMQALAPFLKSDALLQAVKFLVILSNGYGIYLGRYLRFNSWDVLSDPYQLGRAMFRSVLNEDWYQETMAVTVTFSIFLYLVFEIYASLKKRIGEENHELR